LLYPKEKGGKKKKRREKTRKKESGKKKRRVNDMKKTKKNTPNRQHPKNMKTLKQQGIPESEASPSPG
jgi:hypothetical protein